MILSKRRANSFGCGSDAPFIENPIFLTNSLNAVIFSADGFSCTRYTNGTLAQKNVSATVLLHISINSSIIEFAIVISRFEIFIGLPFSSSSIFVSGKSKSIPPFFRRFPFKISASVCIKYKSSKICSYFLQSSLSPSRIFVTSS